MISKIQSIQEYLSTLPVKTRQNVSIITPTDVKDKCAYHISHHLGSAQVYVPRLSPKASPTEEAYTPRVTVSDTLRGCMTGYGSLADLVNREFENDSMEDSWKGELNINKIDFDYALKPNTSLVYDSEVSDEFWLVPYDKEHINYRSKVIGKLTPHTTFSATNKNTGKKNTIIDIVVLMSSGVMSLGDVKNTILRSGYYNIRYNNNTTEIEQCSRINLNEYQKIKLGHKVTMTGGSDFKKW